MDIKINQIWKNQGTIIKIIEPKEYIVYRRLNIDLSPTFSWNEKASLIAIKAFLVNAKLINKIQWI